MYDPEAEEARALRPRPLWPVALGALAVAAGAGWWALGAIRRPDPLRVLVAIDLEGYWWEGSRPAAVLADDLAVKLEALGFETVRGGDPDVAAALESAADPVAAARALRAAWVVSARLAPQVIEHPVEGGYFEVRVDAPLMVAHVDEPDAASARLEGFAGARTRDRALTLTAETMSDRAFDVALPLLTAHPELKAALAGGAGTADRVARLAPARRFLADRAARLSDAADRYARLAERRAAAEKGPAPVTYHGQPDGLDGLCGSGPGGYLVTTERTRPFVSPDTGKLGRIAALETLEWRAPGGEPRVLWTGYNLYGYAGAAPGGGSVALVEDLFGGAKAVTLVEGDGPPRRLRLHPTHRYSDPRLAPGGASLAVYETPCRRCPSALLVLSAAEGRPLARVPAPGGRFGGFAWVSPTSLAVLVSPGEAREPDDEEVAVPEDAPAVPLPVRKVPAVWLLDLAADPPFPTQLHGEPDGTSADWIAASRDGARLAFSRRAEGASSLVVLDVAERTVTEIPVAGRASAPSFSPDGSHLAFQLVPAGRGSEEVAVVPTAGGAVRRLTRNPHRDRYPTFSAAGDRIYFESLDTDPNFPRRTVAVIASVPFSP